MFAFIHELDCCSILETELWSIYHGVCIVLGRGYHNFVVESDSFVTIELLGADNSRVAPFESINQMD